MNDKIMSLIKNNQAVKYGLVVAILPIIVIVTLVQGGSISDIFSPTVSTRELRALVKDTVNNDKVSHDFSIISDIDVTCDEKLKKKIGATVQCEVDAARVDRESKEKTIDVKVKMISVNDANTPPVIEVQRIYSNE